MDRIETIETPAASLADDSRQPRLSAWQPLPFWMWVVFAGMAILGLFSVNPTLLLSSLLLLPVFVKLLWRRGEPPVLLFACFMQWLQVTAIVFYASFYHFSLSVGLGLPEYERAIWLGLGSLLALALGMRLALIRKPLSLGLEAEADISRFRTFPLFLFYIISFALGVFLESTAFRVPQLTQILLAVANLKWVFVFLFVSSVLQRREGYGLLSFAVFLELGNGVLSYFSSFKSILFVLVIVVLTSPLGLTRRRLVRACVPVGLLLILSVIWSGIKMEYREMLNQGTGQQVVLIPVQQRLGILRDLILGLNSEKLAEAMENLVLRVGYMDFFVLTLENVPDNLPHENGALWGGAILHVLKPRVLFPDKEAIDDSAETRKYTGQEVAGEEQGTSIGLGYLAESYIDFGVPGMFVPVFLLGLFYGLIYRYFVFHGPSRALGFAMACAILVFGAYTIETSNIKLLGGNLMGFLFFALLQRLLGPSFLGGARVAAGAQLPE